MALTLGWYYHLPPCASAREVELVAGESLNLLLDAHLRSGVGVAVAITGSLLDRLEAQHRDCLARLVRAVADGVVEPLASTYHEVCPFLIPPRYLRRQIELDLAIKTRLFGRPPAIFWPGNFAWSPVLAPILAELGIVATLIDEAHLRDAHRTQLWHWLRGDALEIGSTLADTLPGEAVAGSIYRLDAGGGASLRVLVHSAATRRALSFGTVGAIHRAWDDAHLDGVVAGLEASGAFSDAVHLFCGDDGDRVNPVSIHQYRRLLQRAGRSLVLPSSAITAEDAEALEFLPAHAPGGVAFWTDEVSAAYLRLLDEVYRAVDLGAVAESDVLPLQDVFPIFWKRIARSRWFYDRAWALLGGGGQTVR
jgi:hypothetical protein